MRRRRDLEDVRRQPRVAGRVVLLDVGGGIDGVVLVRVERDQDRPRRRVKPRARRRREAPRSVCEMNGSEMSGK